MNLNPGSPGVLTRMSPHLDKGGCTFKVNLDDSVGGSRARLFHDHVFEIVYRVSPATTSLGSSTTSKRSVSVLKGVGGRFAGAARVAFPVGFFSQLNVTVGSW